MNGKWSRRVRNLSAGAAAALVGAAAAFGQVVYLENFESATPNFTSDHAYFGPPNLAGNGPASPLYQVGTYTVDVDPSLWHNLWKSYGGHGGSGKMMIVNAAATGVNCDKKVFMSPKFAVTPNTVYELSYWVALSFEDKPPVLQASINGVALSPSFDAIGAVPEGTWHNVKYLWNSGATTTAWLSLCDELTETFGDDYALDDISLTAKGAEQWCSPGYWRQPQHLDSWAATGLEPADLYSAVFQVLPTVKRKGRACSDPSAVPDSPTLMQVLTYPQCYGGDAFNLVGDALSDLHPDVNFAGNRVENCPLN